jgi:hypothetical protein
MHTHISVFLLFFTSKTFNNISCADLLGLFFQVLTPEEVSLSSLLLKEIFAGYGILSWQQLPFKIKEGLLFNFVRHNSNLLSWMTL